jgi:hypothetical protein
MLARFAAIIVSSMTLSPIGPLPTSKGSRSVATESRLVPTSIEPHRAFYDPEGNMLYVTEPYKQT